MIKKVALVFSLCLLLVGLLAVGFPVIALAQDEGSSGEEELQIVEKLTLAPTFPTVEGIAGGTFSYEMKFNYISENTRVFDLTAAGPQGWEVYMTPQYEKEKKISSIRLEGGYSSTGTTIIVTAMAPFWPLPDPGRYTVTVKAVSDTVEASVDLTAVVTNKFILEMVPASELYDTKATAGKENIFSIKMQNFGTGAIDNVKFSSDKPEGWEIVFKPEKIDTLDAIDEQSVDVSIKPPPKTIAGDYMVTLKASGQQATALDIKIRVTVETPTVWGWAGVAVILVVVVGLVVTFMRFSRR